MTSTVMKASKVPNGADEVVEIKGNSMEPLRLMNGEQVFHSTSTFQLKMVK